MTTPDKKITISKDTLMPLGLVIAICGGVLWISTQLSGINYKLDMLETKLQDQWTNRDMVNWGLRLKMGNPELSIPEIDI
ncbi:MAG: hypothetical protein CMJ25_13095 [Phycisphaerae bacterium]|jgi:hypothetical protein|nr:hypothetical protein [Phycisphaerae bacterium]|tara:strand:+ start:304 stop:543 length:240 start_codon:yes stop_codon:yes gene_type:complete